MLTNAIAQNDEVIPQNTIPNSSDIGRQLKRLRVAEGMTDVEGSIITTEDVGERGIKFVRMSIQNIAQNADAEEAAMSAVLSEKINSECRPNGEIDRTIQTKQTNLENSLLTAMREMEGRMTTQMREMEGRMATQMTEMEARISTRIDDVEASLINSESRENARRLNQFRRSLNSTLFPLPNNRGGIPPSFPATVGSFWNSTFGGRSVEQLLIFYGLANVGTAIEKKQRLAFFCGVQTAATANE
ncbi:hypothetical protein HK098_008150 [Nowakowskiella sp. JEL0407]|nr:hypothetical protein HK098_008150 [Nowakowskiella sp. JEL0407]